MAKEETKSKNTDNEQGAFTDKISKLCQEQTTNDVWDCLVYVAGNLIANPCLHEECIKDRCMTLAADVYERINENLEIIPTDTTKVVH